MSGRVTDASARRMRARDNFVSLGCGYVTLESTHSQLPVLDISITGAQGREHLAEEIIEVLTLHFKRDLYHHVVQRKTA